MMSMRVLGPTELLLDVSPQPPFDEPAHLSASLYLPDLSVFGTASGPDLLAGRLIRACRSGHAYRWLPRLQLRGAHDSPGIRSGGRRSPRRWREQQAR